jgi:hypothetical protein
MDVDTAFGPSSCAASRFNSTPARCAARWISWVFRRIWLYDGSFHSMICALSTILTSTLLRPCTTSRKSSECGGGSLGAWPTGSEESSRPSNTSHRIRPLHWLSLCGTEGSVPTEFHSCPATHLRIARLCSARLWPFSSIAGKRLKSREITGFRTKGRRCFDFQNGTLEQPFVPETVSLPNHVVLPRAQQDLQQTSVSVGRAEPNQLRNLPAYPNSKVTFPNWRWRCRMVLIWHTLWFAPATKKPETLKGRRLLAWCDVDLGLRSGSVRRYIGRTCRHRRRVPRPLQ